MQRKITNALFASLATFALASAGCGGWAIDRTAGRTYGAAVLAAQAQFIYPSCADGASFGHGCGLIAKNMAAPELGASFQTSLRDRYRYADFAAISEYCVLHASTCADPATYEMLAVDSHNAAVRADLELRYRAIEAERVDAHRHELDRAAAAAGAIVTAAAVTALMVDVANAATKPHD